VGAAAIVSGMNDDGHLDDWRLNDAAWMALDFAARYGGRETDALKGARAGQWFLEHREHAAFDHASAVGASDTVAAVEEGQLRHVVVEQKAARGEPEA
jgi:2-phosphosulfolactate phosphatase